MKTMYSILMYARNGNYRKNDSVYSEPENAIAVAELILKRPTIHRVCVLEETERMETQIWAKTAEPVFND
jgi:hypothetical protein